MLKLKNIIVAGSSTLLLTACAGNFSTDAVRNAPSKGNAFQKALHMEYVTLASMEIDEDDWTDGEFFNSRALDAANAKKFGPQNMAAREIPDQNVGSMSSARARLVRALEAGGDRVAPKQAARAQAMFDCWMQEQEENFQPKDIAWCRDGFDVAIAYVEGALKPKMMKPMAKKAPAARFVVYFDFDKSNLNAKAQGVISQIAAAAYAAKPGRISISGHTDKAGANSYNDKLSMMRAKSVAKALSERGISGGALKVESHGENQPWMKTPDGTAQAANRRVQVSFN